MASGARHRVYEVTPTRNPSGIEPFGERPEGAEELSPPRAEFRLASWPDWTGFRALLDVADPLTGDNRA
jgi:hypothetical protein